MEIKPIKNEQEYELALKEMSKVFHAKPDTPEGDRLQLLALVIGDYEDKNHKIKPLTAIEALQCEMEEQGINQAALAKRVGMSTSTISEVLNGKKQMSLTMIKNLYHHFGIPAETLLS